MKRMVVAARAIHGEVYMVPHIQSRESHTIWQKNTLERVNYGYTTCTFGENTMYILGGERVEFRAALASRTSGCSGKQDTGGGRLLRIGSRGTKLT
jgi:hypothetical protein